MYSGSRSTEGALPFFRTMPSSASWSRWLSKAEKSTRCSPGFHVHHSDGALGVGDVFPVALPGLALVRGQHHAVPGEGDHVGLGAVSTKASKVRLPSSSQVNRATRPASLEPGPGVRRQGGAVRGNGHGSHVAVLEGAVLRLHQRFHIDFRPGELLHMAPAVRPARGMAASCRFGR